MRLDLFVKLKYESSTIILFVGITVLYFFTVVLQQCVGVVTVTL